MHVGAAAPFNRLLLAEMGRAVYATGIVAQGRTVEMTTHPRSLAAAPCI